MGCLISEIRENEELNKDCGSNCDSKHKAVCCLSNSLHAEEAVKQTWIFSSLSVSYKKQYIAPKQGQPLTFCWAVPSYSFAILLVCVTT